MLRLPLVCLVSCIAFGSTAADEMPWVAVPKDQKGFVLDPSGRPFVPWGFNYDHDDKGRLIEDYWKKTSGPPSRRTSAR